MIHIEMTHTFPVPVGEAFALVTGIENWAKYMPGFVGVKDQASAHWGKPGDTVTTVVRILGAERELVMTQQEFEQDRLSTYVSRQRGLPDMWHERHFNAIPGGTEYRWVVTFEPRKGLWGLFDRFVIKRTVVGTFQQTVRNLDAFFARRVSGGQVK